MVESKPNLGTAIIKYHPVKSKIITPLAPDLERVIFEALRYQPEGFFYSGKYQNHQWDGYKECYSLATQKFRSGLIHRVLNLLTGLGYTPVVEGFPALQLRKHPSEISYLRGWQRDAILQVQRLVRCGVQAPPRSGKTIFTCGLVDCLREFPVVYLCERLEIALQTVEKFRTFVPDVTVGFIGNGELTVGDVTIITVQSAMAAYDKKYVPEDEDVEPPPPHKERVKEVVQNARVVVYDEYHHAAHDSGQFITEKIFNAVCVVGLSATPWRDDKADLLLERVVGPIGYQVTYSYLIENKLLLPAWIYLYSLPKMQPSADVYQTIYKECIVENEYRNQVIARVAREFHKLGWPHVILVDFIRHGEILHKIIPNSILVTGRDTKKVRTEVKARVERGDTSPIITTLWGEGVDIPALRAVTVACGGASSIEVFQRLRSITPQGNKEYGVVVDFEDRVKYLQAHSTRRRTFYQTEPMFRIFRYDLRKVPLQQVKDG